MSKLLRFLDRNTERLIAIFLLIAIIQVAILLLDIRLPLSHQKSLEIGSVVEHVVLPEGTRVVPVLTSTCPHCKHSVHSWNAIAEAGGAVVGVYLSDPNGVESYIEQNNVAFPLVVPADRPGFMGELGISAVPVTLILDSQDRITYAYEGRLDGPGLVLERLNIERSVR